MASTTLSDAALLRRLGQRIARFRLNRNLTQDTLAREAGVSLATLQRMEAGHSAQITSLVRVLRALDLLENLDVLIPEAPESPVQQAKLEGRRRRRARPARSQSPSSWTWGDEE